MSAAESRAREASELQPQTDRITFGFVKQITCKCEHLTICIAYFPIPLFCETGPLTSIIPYAVWFPQISTKTSYLWGAYSQKFKTCALTRAKSRRKNNSRDINHKKGDPTLKFAAPNNISAIIYIISYYKKNNGNVPPHMWKLELMPSRSFKCLQ